MAEQMLLGAGTPRSGVGLGRERGAQPQHGQGCSSVSPGGGCDPLCLALSPSASRMVEEATEMAVPDAQAAISAYARGLAAIPELLQGCAQQPLTDGRSAVQG